MNQPTQKLSKMRTSSRQKNVLEEAVHREPTTPTIDALKQYLDEVGQYPLLTIKQEQALARCMRAGDAEAYQHFVEANLRLVVSIAMHYNGPEIPLLDRIQEGNLGLMHAATKFDPDLGVHFSTYATYWIHQSIHRAVLAKARLITLPIRTGEQIVKINRLHGRFLQTQGHEPSNEEMSQVLGLSNEQVVELQRAAEWPFSLDVSPNEDQSWADLLEAPDAAGTSHTIAYEALLEHLHHALTLLSPHEREIVERRYGLYEGDTLSFADLCFRFGMTRTGVHQLEQGALQKLKKLLISQVPDVHLLFRDLSH